MQRIPATALVRHNESSSPPTPFSLRAPYIDFMQAGLSQLPRVTAIQNNRLRKRRVVALPNKAMQHSFA